MPSEFRRRERSPTSTAQHDKASAIVQAGLSSGTALAQCSLADSPTIPTPTIQRLNSILRSQINQPRQQQFFCSSGNQDVIAVRERDCRHR